MLLPVEFIKTKQNVVWSCFCSKPKMVFGKNQTPFKWWFVMMQLSSKNVALLVKS